MKILNSLHFLCVNLFNAAITVCLLGALSIASQVQAQTIFTSELAWDLNDVSILFPLPKKNQPDYLLPLGNLLTEEILKEFPRLSVRYDQKKIAQALRVLAFRIDPIKKQMKLVWQPVMPGPGSLMIALDMGIHSFYNLSENQFNTLLSELQQFRLRGLAQGSLHLRMPLQVHPSLVGANAEANLKFITDLITRYGSVANLAKVTAMVLRGGDDMWAFMGFDVVSSKFTPIQIPFTNSRTTQMFINQAIPATKFDNFQITPLVSSVSDPFFDSLLGASKKLENNLPLTEDEILKTLNTAARFENPRLTDVDSLDCVSCHVSQPLRNFYGSQFPQADLTNQYINSNFDLSSTHTTPLNTRRIRAFGYFGSEPAISERVINESAEVADVLNQLSNLQKRNFK